MTTRTRVLVALTALPALVLAGCATTVAGDPRPAVTFSSTPTTSSSPPPTSVSSSSPVTTSSSVIPPIPPSSLTTPASDTSTTTTSSAATIGGVSIPDVLDDLADDNVALVNSSANADDLASAVSDARGKGLDLSVVSIGDDVSDTDAGNIADAVFAAVKGTVLVLTPKTITSRSDQLTGAQLKDANKAASSGKDDLEAVQKYAASALGADGPTTSKATTSKATTSKATTTAPSKDVINGVDVVALANAAAKDGVAVQNGVSGVDRADLVALVKSSASKDLHLTIFVLADDVSGHLYDVADGVRKYTKGTVIGMSPTVYAISSDSFSNAQLQAAIDAASDASTYLDVAKKMVSSLLSS